MADTKLLNKLLQTPQKLAKELNTKSMGRLTTLLDSLIDQNYEFTQDQFELYLNQACEQNKNKYSFIATDNPTAKKINTYMVNKFPITETHVTEIINGLSNVYFTDKPYILTMLMNKQYIFTVPQLKLLVKFHYGPTNIYNTMNNNTMYIGCKAMNLNGNNEVSPLFTNLITKLKNGYQFENDHLMILLLFTNK